MRTLMILGVLAVWVLTPSESQGTADGEGGKEAIEFENLMIPAAPTKSLAQRLPCCRLWSKKPCQFCPGSFSAVRLPIDIPATPTEMTMESMDSEVLDANVRRLAKRQLPSSPNPPQRCCRRKKKNCPVCPSGNTPLRRNFEDTTTEQMESMDSEVLDVNVRRLAKRQLQSSPNPPPRCCKRGKCWRCTGVSSPIANYFNDTTSDQMKSMDSEVLDVNVRRLAKRQLPSSQDNPPRCCRWKKICRGCTGGNTPLGRNFEDTTTEQMESMDSEVLDVNVRRLAKRQLPRSQDNSPRCCRWKKTCWACTGGNTPLGRNFEDTTTEETANPGNEDLTVQRQTRFRRSAMPCCQGNSERPPGCRHCPGAYSKSFQEKSGA